jgi:hypothetical protein
MEVSRNSELCYQWTGKCFSKKWQRLTDKEQE